LKLKHLKLPNNNLNKYIVKHMKFYKHVVYSYAFV